MSPIVYEYRTVHLERTGVEVSDVLVGVCRETGEILTIPAQSTPRLKEAREARKEETCQVRLPGQLLDVLWLLAEHYDADGKKFWPAVVLLPLRGRPQAATRGATRPAFEVTARRGGP